MRVRSIAVLLGLATLWQLFAALLMPATWIGSYLTHDDTYLALRVAQGWAEHGFPTFDGLHRTNGFHPLWGLLLAGLARVFSDPLALLRATLVLCAGLNLATGILLARLASRLRPHDPGLGVLTVAFWSAYALSGKPSLIGLENSLLPLFVCLLVHALVGLFQRPQSVGCWVGLGFIGVAAVWSRLDAAIFVAFAVLIALAQVRWRARNVGVALCAVILAAGGMGYVAFQRWANHTNTPVSGMVKHAIAARLEQQRDLRWLGGAALNSTNSVLKHASIGLGLIRPRAVSAGIRFVLIAGLVYAFVCVRTPPLRWLELGLLVLLVHAALLRVWVGEMFHDALWYYSATNALAGVGVAYLLFECCRGAAARAAWVRIGVAIFALRLAYSGWLLTQAPAAEAVAPVRQAAAAWIQQHVRSGERVAAWNAGELSYFSGATLINLDGLVNDAEFCREMVIGRGSMDAYLSRQNVDWVVDYASTAQEDSGRLWGVLDPRQWKIVARFGDHPDAAQLVARRAAD
jgi:hypothetical protein